LIHDIVLITGELKRGFAPLTKPIPLPLDKGKGIKVEDSSRDRVT